MKSATSTKPILAEGQRNGAGGSTACDIGNLNIEVTTVTPELAGHWLSRGGKNRHTSQRKVDRLAAAMHRGEWQLTGEAIKLDDDGRVRDGKHRLTAIVQSGVTIQTVVVRGVSEDAFDVMDTGTSRTVADVFSIHGHASHNGLAAAVRILMFYERWGRFDPDAREARVMVNTVTSRKYLGEHPDVANGLRLGDRVRHVGLQGGIGVWAALFTLFLRLDAEYAHLFAHYLATGEDMSAGHPALLLRNRLLWNRGAVLNKGRADRELLGALTIKAWNAFRRDKTIGTLTWRGDGPKPEAFPKPV